MPGKKYLTEEKFEQWKTNEFIHLVKKVARTEGILWVIAPLVIAILAIVVFILKNG